MKYTDINRKFTDTVSSYLANGYHFNTATMNGSQGEISAVDLTNGREIIRVLLQHFSGKNYFDGGIEIVVGRVKESERIQPNSSHNMHDIIWNGRLEVTSCERFYELSRHGSVDPFFGTEAESDVVSEKRLARYSYRHDQSSTDITEKAAPLVKEYIREKFGVRRVITNDIKVTKNRGKYTVSYHEHRAQLH